MGPIVIHVFPRSDHCREHICIGVFETMYTAESKKCDGFK
jgi:hypothetical protein